MHQRIRETLHLNQIRTGGNSNSAKTIMKTYNGKNITKKYIQSVIRTENSTEIFRLYHLVFGGEKPRSLDVCKFIREYAPTKTLAQKAAAFSGLNKRSRLSEEAEHDQLLKSFAWRKENARHLVLCHFREELKRGFDSYSKRPTMGHTHLWWCSPVHGHADYNKSIALPIEGNERFCELICRAADKHFKFDKQ